MSSSATVPVIEEPLASTQTRIPLALKIVYTLFVAVLVPYYWRNYGPANFLYFCDIALLVTVVALWIENRLLISMQAVAILLPQALWILDFFSIALFGKGPLNMASYMFDSNIPLFVRGLSSFHLWLPFLLVWLVWRLGYDRRALLMQVLVGWIILLICYFLLPGPTPDTTRAVNINYVYGMSSSAAQTWLHPHLWFAMLMVVFPVGIYLPTHLLLKQLLERRGRQS